MIRQKRTFIVLCVALFVKSSCSFLAGISQRRTSLIIRHSKKNKKLADYSNVNNEEVKKGKEVAEEKKDNTIEDVLLKKNVSMKKLAEEKAESIVEKEEVSGTEEEVSLIEDESKERDSKYIQMAIELAKSCGEELDYPFPICGGVLVSDNEKIIGKGCSSFDKTCVEAIIEDAGIGATPLREWCVTWPSNKELRDDISSSTLYLTLEPCKERKGTSLPPITQLIEYSSIPRVVIGSPDPILERSSVGAAALHSAGIEVIMGVEQEACQLLYSDYSTMVNNKFLTVARKHSKKYNRPLGLLHCSVIDSKDAAAYARSGNAFSRDLGGQTLSMRDFGSYEIAPPPEMIWAGQLKEEDDEEEFSLYLDEEDEQDALTGDPMMPWYQQVDAVVATFPKQDDSSFPSEVRFNGLKWLATHGESLPPTVERILVMDANDLPCLPVSNDHSKNALPGIDIERFWRGVGRKPVRILLRHSANAKAAAAAEAAATAAQAAASAAEAALMAVESGDAEDAADVALEYEKASLTAAKQLQDELQEMHDLKQRLTLLGCTVESIKGGKPIHVMNHLGARNGYESVVWRAGCWGEHGVESILAGAFQWVSAHLAVDAVGGKFWQLMLAERCVQAACGPESKVKIFAHQEDVSLEYCDDELADSDCILTLNGKPVRHVRLDSRVALVDQSRKRELIGLKTVPMKKEFNNIEAPWFL